MAAFSCLASNALMAVGVLFFVAVICSTMAEDPLLLVYEKWIRDYGRVYKSELEKQQRFEVFKTNFKYIESMKNQPNLTYTMGLNEFADLTNEEFLTLYADLESQRIPKTANHIEYANLTTTPTCTDFRSLGSVTPVKNQGNCGSSWACCVTGAIEGIHKIKTGTLLSLSMQELVDCDTSNSGCNGGYIDYAFQWIIYNGGITTEADYPYTSGSTGTAGTCNYPKTYDHAVSILSFQCIATNCESCLLNVVASQPVCVKIDASGSAFQFYSGGIFTGPCGTNPNLYVLIVGYGPCSTGTPYWIVKNCWGTSWGESGYIRIRRNTASPSGLCGINMEACYPTM